MDTELEVMFPRQPGGFLHHVETRRVQTRGLRHVLVGIEQPGAVRSQRPIDQALDSPNGEEAVAAVDHPIAAQPLGQGLVALVHHHPEPQRQGPVVRQLPIDIDQSETGTRVLEARDAFGQTLFTCEPHDLPRVVRLESLGTQPGDEGLGGLPERAGRLTVRVPYDLPAFWIDRRGIDAGQLHRLRVREGHVAAGMTEKHRVLRRHRAQAVVRRQSLNRRNRQLGPLRLVPAPAQDPGSRLSLRYCFCDLRDDLVPGSRPIKRQLEPGLPNAPEMAVSLNEPGNAQPPLQVENLRTGTDPGAYVVARADEDDPTAGSRERFRFGRARQSHQAAVQDHQVRRIRTASPTAGQDDSEQRPDDRAAARTGTRVHHPAGMRNVWPTTIRLLRRPFARWISAVDVPKVRANWLNVSPRRTR